MTRDEFMSFMVILLACLTCFLIGLSTNQKTITIKFDTIKKVEQEVHHAR